MKDFDYLRATHLPTAVMEGGRGGSRILAGGTTLLDLMKCGVEIPDRIVDITRLGGLADIDVGVASIRIGALATMSQCAGHPALTAAAPALSEALSLAASAQIRNMSTIGGNLLQRTRCSYFRDPAAYTACNKRNPGSGCAALNGVQRNHAILGVSDSCIATYPGDFAVALVAFGATLRLAGKDAREAPIDSFYHLPKDRPDREHELAQGDMIVGVDVPLTPLLRRSTYLKVRDRASYEFAAASAAVGIELESDAKTVRAVRVALGGVATRPWRALAVEQARVGKTFTEANVPREHNRYKVELTPKVVARALMKVGGLV